MYCDGCDILEVLLGFLYAHVVVAFIEILHGFLEMLLIQPPWEWIHGV
jgi:hypothetical protein